LGKLKTIIAKIESDVLHVPEDVKGIMGPDTKLVVGTAAVLAFSAGTSYRDILRSVELIRDDLELRAAEEKAQAKKTEKTKRH
jgi:hypothetical protein